MKRKNMFVSLAVVLLVLSLGFGCDLFNIELTDSGDSATSYALTPYREVILGDLTPLGDAYDFNEELVDIPDVDFWFTADMIELLGVQWDWLIGNTNDYLYEGYSFKPTRSVGAVFYLSVQDEAFAFVDDQGTENIADDVTATEFAIEQFDFLSSGRINSLSSLIGLMTGADVFPVDILEMDGAIGLSAFLAGTEYDVTPADVDNPEFQREVLTSLFIDIGIEHEEPLSEVDDPSTVISGEANLSFGFNYLPYDETYVVRAPMVLQFNILPFSVDLDAWDDFMDGIDDATDEFDYIEANWAAFAALLWGSGHANDGVVITLLGGNADGSVRHEATLDGFDAFEVMYGLIISAL
ncbi:MAG: hypothetical protein AB7S52_04945 [Sphaerochaetaceae bacterium]